MALTDEEEFFVKDRVICVMIETEKGMTGTLVDKIHGFSHEHFYYFKNSERKLPYGTGYDYLTLISRKQRRHE